MTARLRYVLVCDAEDCSDEFDADIVTAGETRRLATADGWTCNVVEKRPSGPARVRDFCPEHKP
jgi:hypothetical protein